MVRAAAAKAIQASVLKTVIGCKVYVAASFYTRGVPNPPSETLVFDRSGIRELDRLAIAQWGMRGIDLMERAAQGAMKVAVNLIQRGGQIGIVCGTGNNGGDGWAMGRMLYEDGWEVHMVSPRASREGSDAAANEQATRAIGIPVHKTLALCPEMDLLIDAVLGTGLEQAVTGVTLELIDAINAHDALVLAVDMPSGLNANTGLPCDVAVQAAATATFAGLKVGMLETCALAYTGEVHVIDIGMPRSLAESLSQSS